MSAARLSHRMFLVTICAAALVFGPLAGVSAAAPENDDFADATVLSITGPSPLTGSNVGATVESNEPTHQYIQPVDTDASVWWRFTPPRDGAVSFSTSGSSFPTVLAIYTGDTLFGLHAVYQPGTGSFPLSVRADEIYHVAVASYEGGATGNIVLGFTWSGFGAGTISVESPTGVPAKSIDAGTVAVGSSANRTVFVRNTGSGPLTVRSATITTRSFANGEYQIVSDSATGQAIPPGQVRQIVVAFAPKTGSSGSPDALQYLGSLPGYPTLSTYNYYSSATGLVDAIAIYTYFLNAGGSGSAAWTATATSGSIIRGQDQGTTSLVGGDAYVLRAVGSVAGSTTESRMEVTLPTNFSATRVLRPAPPALTLPAFTGVREVEFARLPDAVLVLQSDDAAAETGSIVGLFGHGVGSGGTSTAGEVTRWSGADRYATAAMVSAKSFATGVGVVFVATGANFPDALAGGPAGGMLGGPILLTGRDSLPLATVAELTRLDAQGIVVLGGRSAVSDAVISQLRSFTSGGVSRWSGPDRYATATVVSAKAFPQGADVVFLATGANFPDALAGGPAAGALGGPILLTERDSLPPATLAELGRLRPAQIVILGGRAAVSDALIAQLTPYASDGVSRWSGPDRYATAAAVSAKAFPGGADVVFVATGANFPDALAGGPVGGALGGPILLTERDTVPTATLTEVARLRPEQIVILGGRSAVSDAVLNQLAAYHS